MSTLMQIPADKKHQNYQVSNEHLDSIKAPKRVTLSHCRIHSHLHRQVLTSVLTCP